MSVTERIQRAAEEDALVIGARQTIKNVDDIEVVVIASNAPDEIRERVLEEADGTTVEQPDIDNQELGSLCMKPFTASVVGITSA